MESVTTQPATSQARLPDPEDWTKLTDINSRRRIQNRIAQRNRRKKLKGSRDEKETERLSRTPEQLHPRSGAMTDSVLLCRDLESGHDQASAPEFVMQTPYLKASSSVQLGTTLSNTPSLYQEPQSDNDTKAMLNQIDQAQLQLREFLAEESTGLQLTAPRASHDFSGPNENNFWDMPLINNLNPTSLSHINAPREDFFDPLMDNENSISRTRSSSPPNNNKDMFLTPQKFSSINLDPTSVLNPCRFTQAQDFNFPNSTSPSLTRSDSSDDLENTHGNTALHLAAQKGHLPIVRLLLETGASIDATNEDGLSALHIAISEGHLTIVQYLISQHANSNLVTHDNQNMLHLAVGNGDVAIVKILLDNVVDPDSRDSNGKTAFHRAVAMGNEGVVRAMLLKGVNSQAKVGDQTPAGDGLTFDWATVAVR